MLAVYYSVLVVLFSALSYHIYKKHSKVSTTIIFIAITADVILAAQMGLRPAWPTMVFSLNGVRGSFAYHKFNKAKEDKTE